MSIKLIIFDFDGTLIDTGPDICRATNEFLQLHGRQTLSHEEITAHIGMGLTALIRGVIPEAQHHPELVDEINAQFNRIYDQHILKNPSPFPGVEEFLPRSPWKIAIASNKPERYLHLLLRHLGWSELPWVKVIGGDTLPTLKPSPEPLQEIMRAAQVRPSETLMVGDGPPDVGAALAAQTHLLAVSYGYSSIEELRALGAEHWIGQFSDLSGHIRQLETLVNI